MHVVQDAGDFRSFDILKKKNGFQNLAQSSQAMQKPQSGANQVVYELMDIQSFYFLCFA